MKGVKNMEYESYEKPSFDRERRPSGDSRFGSGGGQRGPPRRGGFSSGGSYGGSRGGQGGGFESRSFAPVKVGEELDVTIEALAEKGDGVAKKNGFVLFVPNTKVGDRVKIRVNKVLRKVGFAEVIGPAGTEAPAQEQQRNTPAPPAKEPMPEDSENFGESSEEYSDEFQDEE